MTAKYKLGQTVLVKHAQGFEWEGEITYVGDTGEAGNEVWEYEVSNAPYDRELVNIPRIPLDEIPPGNRWSPLVWEQEIVEVVE